MVYVDPLFNAKWSASWPFKLACHLWADSLEELHEFAARLGLRRAWFHNSSSLGHYDLTTNKRRLALRLGAREANLREYFRQKRATCSS